MKSLYFFQTCDLGDILLLVLFAWFKNFNDLSPYCVLVFVQLGDIVGSCACLHQPFNID